MLNFKNTDILGYIKRCPLLSLMTWHQHLSYRVTMQSNREMLITRSRMWLSTLIKLA